MASIGIGESAQWLETVDGSVVNLAMCYRLHIDATGRLLAGFSFGDVVVAHADSAATVLANLKPSLTEMLAYASVS